MKLKNYEKWPSIQKDVLKKKQNQFFEIAGKIIVQKDDAGEVTLNFLKGNLQLHAYLSFYNSLPFQIFKKLIQASIL